MSIPITSPAQANSAVNTTQSKTLVLNEGQMDHDQIKQLFLGQTAEVQI